MTTESRPGAEPQKLDLGADTVAYSIRVTAPAEQIYRLLADPHRHHEVDGSHTVRSRAVGPHELTEGAKFSVHMRKFGLPYRLPLRVTRAHRPGPGSPGVVEWRQPTGHRWRWEFQDHQDGTTTVTEAFDTTGQNPAARAGLKAAGALKQNAHSIKASLRRVRDRFEPSGPTDTGQGRAPTD